MNISQLIESLQNLKDIHGDIPCVHLSRDDDYETPEGIETIETSYFDNQTISFQTGKVIIL